MRFAPEIILKLKEFEPLLAVGFIKIVHVKKKNGKLRVCIDFRDLNAATPKDDYQMPMADTLVDPASSNEIMY